ncbi:MAG: glycosyltransferase family 2 protein [Lachnospiraceae bacterium]
MKSNEERQVQISIITVTRNSEETLKKTIESVLNQTLSPKEYLIIDGNSSDGTVALAECFHESFAEKGITYRIYSEPDAGIYDAMNKGIKLASGEIIGMINSNDWYEPEALQAVADVYRKKGFDLFFADLRMHLPNGGTFIKPARNRSYATSRDWNHPTTFITKRVYEKHPYKTETIHDDYDLILRLKREGVHIETLNRVLADFCMNGTSHERSFQKAWQRVIIKYRIYRNNGYSPFYFLECLAVEAAKLIVG